jgi:hypothetical protein
MIFSPNQEVVCIDKECKSASPGATKIPNIHYNSIYTINRYESYRYGMWFVSVKELPEAFIYSEDSFAPLMEINELVEQLEECYE